MSDLDEDKTWRPRPRASGEEGDEAELPLPVGWLVVVSGPGKGSVATLETGVNILGRSPESQVPLDFGDRHISRDDHMRISYNRKTRRFRVLPGKGTETWVRGDELVDEPRDLAHGEQITIGDTVLRFVAFCDDTFDWLESDPA
ncbi:MAG: FHA domain-containing protein [Sphingomonas sp.]